MCRIYRNKDGSYVRLCYHFKGVHVYFAGGTAPIGPIGHYIPMKHVSRKDGR